jgi:hypothetical protein
MSNDRPPGLFVVYVVLMRVGPREGHAVVQKARKPAVTRPAAASAAGKTLASPQATAAEKKAAAALRETPLKKTKK